MYSIVSVQSTGTARVAEPEPIKFRPHTVSAFKSIHTARMLLYFCPLNTLLSEIAMAGLAFGCKLQAVK
jgi:hypothetical protein